MKPGLPITFSFIILLSLFFLDLITFDYMRCSIGIISTMSSGPLELSVAPGRKLIDIFTFQRNEGRLLLDWGAWHGSIFGFDALHILDHQSDDPRTKLYLSILASKGAHVVEYTGSFREKAAQLTKYMASSEAKFLMPIDVDEFLVSLVNTSSFLVSSQEMLNTFRYLPADGRRYRMKHIDAMYCPSRSVLNTHQWSDFSRPQGMTVFRFPPTHLDCISKTFYLRGAFLGTDQGNHFGAVTTDEHDSVYTVNGCPYYHSPSIGLVHYGTFLPWELKRDKMIRGAEAYNHTALVKAGEECPPMTHGIHYCLFFKRLLEIGQQAMQAEYEKEMPSCAPDSTFESHELARRIGIVLNQIDTPMGVKT